MADKKNKKSGDDSLEGASTIIQPSDPEKPTSGEPPPDESSLSDSGSAPDPGTISRRSPHFGRFIHFANLYSLIFILLILLGAGGIIAAIKFNSKSAGNNTSKIQSLTDKQISDLKNNTTLVGDAQQTLDIQGNSIFEGQVLMRNNLDVAGSIKIGGSLSLPAITVGGTSSFGQIQVNDTLSVNGNTNLQGSLTVRGGLSVAGNTSFGTLSAGQLNVTSLNMTGDITISRHISVAGGTPSRAGGSALGSGGTVSNNGSDTAGTVTVNTGGGPPAGCFVTINFAQRFNTTPRVIISPSNSSAGTINYYTNRSANNFSICTASAPAGSTTYIFDYIVFD